MRQTNAQLTLDPKAAIVKLYFLLRVGDDHIQIELFEGPAVRLGYILAGGRDVGLGQEQTSQPNLAKSTFMTNHKKRHKHPGISK